MYSFNLGNWGRRLLPVLALVAFSACAEFRESRSPDGNVRVGVHTVDNGAGATATFVDGRLRQLNPTTGERDGPWVDTIHVIPGTSNAQVAIAGVFGLGGAVVGAVGNVMAADRLSCQGRGCGNGVGNVIQIQNSSGSVSNAGAAANATATRGGCGGLC